MADIEFTSSLTNEEIEKNFKDIDFFSGIMSGLEEALNYEQGKAKAETVARKKSLPCVDCRNLRKSLNMTQKDFARILGVSSRTVESWEIGRTTPSPTAKNLLYLISKNPSLVSELV